MYRNVNTLRPQIWRCARSPKLAAAPDCSVTCAQLLSTARCYILPIFIRPSLDGTYYGMALSVRPSVRPTVSTKKHRCKWRIFFKFCTQVCLGVPLINLLFVLSYLIKYAHNSIISDFSIFGIHRVIFSCDQAALQMVFSVRLSVRLSVCPSVCLSHLFHHVPIIVSSWNFQELLPWSKVMSMQKVKVRGQRSRSQRSRPNLTVSGL